MYFKKKKKKTHHIHACTFTEMPPVDTVFANKWPERLDMYFV